MTKLSQIRSIAGKLLSNPKIELYRVNYEDNDWATGQPTTDYVYKGVIKAVWLRRDKIQEWLEEGVVEQGDGYLQVDYDLEIDRDDKIVVTKADGNVDNYRVDSAHSRGKLYKFVVLKLW
jgi:hypothetical protein